MILFFVINLNEFILLSLFPLILFEVGFASVCLQLSHGCYITPW